MPSKTVTACVLIIGNEILSGRTQDLNLQYIAKHLATNGVTVTEARVIPDIEEVIVNTVNEVRATHDYVLTTGGIGPTHDDITADCIARAFGVPLVINETIAERIRRRPAPDDVMRNRLLMARIPKGAKLIDNVTGGPQGFSIGNVYVMAGIPEIAQAMLPTVKFEGGAIVESCSVTAQMGESDIAQDLREIQADFSSVDLGSYPFFRDGIYGTSLVMRGTSREDLTDMMTRVKSAIERKGSSPVDERYDWQ